jgi:hypothetical protein
MYRDLTSQNRVLIIPHIGSLQLKDVKPLHCQKILNAMGGLSATHIKKVRQLLYAMFEAALDNGLVPANPGGFQGDLFFANVGDKLGCATIL